MANELMNTFDSGTDLVTRANFNVRIEQGNTNFADLENIVSTVSAKVDTKPSATTADITYYVATTGNDSNNGIAVGTPFLTIAKAISMIPQIVNHTITIQLAIGTYAENVKIEGFTGKGTINLYGDTILSTSYTITSLFISGVSGVKVVVQGINASTTVDSGFNVLKCSYVEFMYCRISSVASTKNGFNLEMSSVWLYGCWVSNRSKGIYASNARVASSSWNAGSTGNTIGIYANYAATVGKDLTQPAGTTAETVARGGVIR